MKRVLPTILIFLTLLAFISCKEDRSSEVDTIKEYGTTFVVTSGESKDISFAQTGAGVWTYQWYTCNNLNKEDPSAIVGATSNSYSTGQFTQNEIKYFYCIATNGNTKVESQTFCVAKTGLPRVEITTDNKAPVETRLEYIDGNITVYKADGTTDLNDKDVSIKGRGRTSWTKHTKKSFNIKLGDKTKVLSMKKSKKWCLIGTQSDPTMHANWYASYLGHNVFNTYSSQWQPSFVLVDFFLNGEYMGLYSLGENISIEDKRINITDISKLTKEGENAIDSNQDGVIDLYDGGFIVEFTCAVENASFVTLHGSSVVMKDPDLDKAEGDWSETEILNHIKKLVNEAEYAIYSDNLSTIENYFKVESLVDWYLLNEFVANREAGFETSVFMYYDPSLEGGKFVMGPNWDYDKSIVNKTGIWVNIPRSNWFTQLLENEDFCSLVKAKWSSVTNNNIARSTSSQINTSINALEAEMVKEKALVGIELDSTRWGKEKHVDLVSKTENWFVERLSFFNSYIEGLPGGEQ